MFDFFTELWSLYDGETYQVLSFTPDTLRTVFIFLWLGAVIAFIFSYYSNNYLGKFVQKLISVGAKSPESAKTLAELSLANASPLAYSLREESVLRRTVKCVKAAERVRLSEQGDNCDNMSNVAEVPNISSKKKAKERIDDLAFYIPEAEQSAAQRRYRVKGNGILALIVSIAASTVILFLLLVFGPWLMQIVDSALSAF